jgi:hypothetical protein
VFIDGENGNRFNVLLCYFQVETKKNNIQDKKKIEFVVNSIDFDFQIVSVNKNYKFHKINMREIEI